MPKPTALNNLKALHMSLVGGILFVNPELGFFVLVMVLGPVTFITERDPTEFQVGYVFLVLFVSTMFEGWFPRRISAAFWGLWSLFWMYWTVGFLVGEGTVWSNTIFWLPHLGMSIFAGTIALKIFTQQGGLCQRVAS